MAHKYYYKYHFVVGSDWHDSHITVEAYTKAEAMKKAREYKVRPDDHVNYIGRDLLCTWVPGKGWV